MSTRLGLLLLFIGLVVGAGWVIGATNLPGAWYAGLQKPPFYPPNRVFPIAWTVLYVMIAIAGWRTYLRNPTGVAMQLWFGQLALNFLWSPIFFTLHSMLGGLAIILALLAAIVGFIGVQWRDDRLASVLFVPYAVWVGFASLLNYMLYRLN
ncbi:tryptophan-rich sensory protein [Bradyrhizobium jicamae]|uniref:TspO/MBR family protein n=1 Tax=Bradyrhizobium jicamae TaxID=280332 RepID=UPI001BA5CFA7|nr:TspO/MBR family protein [Bradyrhizobium jicamae]MBR0755642.1 tryptophan-rich sensory protein [Bradyrhizobium jicamae]